MSKDLNLQHFSSNTSMMTPEMQFGVLNQVIAAHVIDKETAYRPLLKSIMTKFDAEADFFDNHKWTKFYLAAVEQLGREIHDDELLKIREIVMPSIKADLAEKVDKTHDECDAGSYYIAVATCKEIEETVEIYKLDTDGIRCWEQHVKNRNKCYPIFIEEKIGRLVKGGLNEDERSSIIEDLREMAEVAGLEPYELSASVEGENYTLSDMIGTLKS